MNEEKQKRYNHYLAMFKNLEEETPNLTVGPYTIEIIDTDKQQWVKWLTGKVDKHAAMATITMLIEDYPTHSMRLVDANELVILTNVLTDIGIDWPFDDDIVSIKGVSI